MYEGNDVLKSSELGQEYAGYIPIATSVKQSQLSLRLKRKSRVFLLLLLLLVSYVWYSQGTTTAPSEPPTAAPSEPALSRQTPPPVVDKKMMMTKEQYKLFLDFVQSRNSQLSTERDPKDTFRSTYQCLGRQTDIQASHRRPCQFQNVCYHVNSGEFEYFQPAEDPVFYDSMQGPLFSFSNPDKEEQKNFIQVSALYYGAVSHFSPVVKLTSPSRTDASTVWVNETTTIFASWSYEYNIGHFVFEELASVYMALVRFGRFPLAGGQLSKPAIQLLDMNHPGEQNPNKDRYASMIRDFSGPFTSSASHSANVQDMKGFLRNKAAESKASRVCFQDLIVASATQSFLSPHAEYQMGTEPIWAQYRADILLSHGIDTVKKPTSHLLVMVKKTTSLYKSRDNGRVHFRDIVNYDALLGHIKSAFGDSLTVVELDPLKMTVREQLKLMANTTILITPPGGISMMIPFLPHGSHAIVLDYFESEDNWLVSTRGGESVSMEASLWNVFPHVIKQYYQIMYPNEEIVPDFEGATSTREDFSVKVNLSRMEYMVRMALRDFDF